MSIKLDDLKQLLGSIYPVYRDLAPKNTEYPYIVITFIDAAVKWGSSNVYRILPSYQIALFTTGTEEDINPLIDTLSKNKVPFDDFTGIDVSENQIPVMNYYTEVRVIG